MSSVKSIPSIFASHVLLLALIVFSCNNNEPEHPNTEVNNWIYSNMNYWYYWNADLPASSNSSQNPDVYFNSLLNENDRFSWIQNNFLELKDLLQGVGKEAGYEVALFRERVDTDVLIGQIVYIKPGTPAEAAGLKRGDRINRINGMPITLSNYKNLLSSISEEHLLTYQSLDLASQAFGAEQELKVSSVVYAENPNFLTKIFEYNDRKVGYYIYNLFSVGPTSTSTQYNDEMDQVFAGFQSAGITDLILDLRFNSGGAETASTNLASLLGKDVDATKIFSFREYNANVTATIKKDPELIDQYLSIEFINKSQNIGSQLRNNRIYILTGSRTASASELLINGLRPYMDVFLIGSKTVGKNVGSITLNEENNPNNTWGMQPIVSKSFNSLNQSDYSAGFNPQILLEDNSEFPYPLGDPQERLLSRALQEITGETNSGRLNPYNPMGAEAGHSLDLKKRSNVLLLDPVVQNSLRNLLENQ